MNDKQYPFLNPTAEPITRFYAVFDHQPETIEDYQWREWRNCGPDKEQDRLLVVHRFIRNRGGAEGLKTIFLYERDGSEPTYRNGQPQRCTAVEYKVTT